MKERRKNARNNRIDKTITQPVNVYSSKSKMPGGRQHLLICICCGTESGHKKKKKKKKYIVRQGIGFKTIIILTVYFYKVSYTESFHMS